MNERIEKWAKTLGGVLALLIILAVLGYGIWLVVSFGISFIKNPSKALSAIRCDVVNSLRDFLGWILLAIPVFGFSFGAWWILKKGEIIARLNNTLCPKCRENSKYLSKKLKSLIVAAQIILLLALLVTVCSISVFVVCTFRWIQPSAYF